MSRSDVLGQDLVRHPVRELRLGVVAEDVDVADDELVAVRGADGAAREALPAVNLFGRPRETWAPVRMSDSDSRC